MPKMSFGQIIRELAAGFLFMYAIAFFATSWIAIFSLSIFGAAAGFGYVVLGILSTALSGVAGWWLTRRKLWLLLGGMLSALSFVSIIVYGIATVGPLRGGLPPPFGAVVAAGLPGLAYFVPRPAQ